MNFKRTRKLLAVVCVLAVTIAALIGAPMSALAKTYTKDDTVNIDDLKAGDVLETGAKVSAHDKVFSLALLKDLSISQYQGDEQFTLTLTDELLKTLEEHRKIDWLTVNDRFAVVSNEDTSEDKVGTYLLHLTPYFITFDANGKTDVTGLPEVQAVERDALAKKPTDPSVPGYAFGGWYLEAACENEYDFAVTKNDKDRTVYAKWTANEYSVTFDANGGTGTMANQGFTYDVEKTLTANAFARTGYTFAGWMDDAGTAFANVSLVKNLAVSGSVTLHAQWVANTYEVAFDANGGTGAMANQGFTYDVEQALTANAFTRTGYTFTGWNTKADGTGTTYADAAAVKNLATSGTVTLYAQWKLNTYTVAFNANGSTNNKDISGTMDPQSFTYGEEKALTTNAFTRKGHTFTGWNTKADGKGTAYQDAAAVKNLSTADGAVVTLYAQWKADTVKVSFNANGGKGTMADQSFEYGVAGKLRINTFTRSGYTFTGWNTKADGKGASFKNRQSVKVTSNVTLYAQWTKKSTATKSTATKATKSASTSSSSSLAKTGDPTSVMAISAMATAGAGLIFAGRRKRR